MAEAIKASDARQMAKDGSRIIAENELTNVYVLIKKACSNGEFELTYDKDLSLHAIKRLTDLGYSCTQLKPGVKINWDEKS